MINNLRPEIESFVNEIVEGTFGEWAEEGYAFLLSLTMALDKELNNIDAAKEIACSFRLSIKYPLAYKERESICAAVAKATAVQVNKLYAAGFSTKQICHFLRDKLTVTMVST